MQFKPLAYCLVYSNKLRVKSMPNIYALLSSVINIEFILRVYLNFKYTTFL